MLGKSEPTKNSPNGWTFGRNIIEQGCKSLPRVILVLRWHILGDKKNDAKAGKKNDENANIRPSCKDAQPNWGSAGLHLVEDGVCSPAAVVKSNVVVVATIDTTIFLDFFVEVRSSANLDLLLKPWYNPETSRSSAFTFPLSARMVGTNKQKTFRAQQDRWILIYNDLGNNPHKTG